MKERISFLSFSIIALLFFGSSCDKNDFDFENNPEGNFDALWTILVWNYWFFD